jgi:tol-pal system protein YbgF
MKKMITILIIMTVFLGGCASQDDILILDERLSALEVENRQQARQLADYSENSQSKERNLRDQSASLRALIDGIRKELQIINGKLEEVEFRIQQERKALDESMKTVDFKLNQIKETQALTENRLKQVEQYLDLTVAGTGAAAAAATAPGSARTESDLYQIGKQAFERNDFDTARNSFQELLNKYPNSRSADNAQFWIGEIYYREKWYEKAILEYQKVIEKYPKGNKVLAAILKQGYAFFNLGDKTNSRIILKELIKKHPDSKEAKIAEQKLRQIQ